jgi:hypothetical protein
MFDINFSIAVESKRMESGGQYENGRYKPDYYKGTQSVVSKNT